MIKYHFVVFSAMFEEESLSQNVIRPGSAERFLSRRDFIKLGAAAAATALMPVEAQSALSATEQAPKRLNLYNLHTHERLTICYCRDGKYDRSALKKINYILRDHRSGDIKPINTGLLDLLNALSIQLKTAKPFHIISGYRSPSTNNKLRHRSRGVASKSLHLVGKAIDIRVPNVSTRALRDTAVKIEGGGVGYYPKAGFVHVDVGKVRYW